LAHLLCVGGIISLFVGYVKNIKWLIEEHWLCGVILVLLVLESIFVGLGFPLPIVPVPRCKFSFVTLLSNLIYLAFQKFMSLHVSCLTVWSRDSHQWKILEMTSLTGTTTHESPSTCAISSRVLVFSWMIHLGAVL